MACCLLALVAAVSIFSMATCQISEPQQYAATVVPKDPTAIRQILGYDKYDGREVRNSDRTVRFGNNWELFDNRNEAPAPSQNQYYGRYYRSILNYY